MIKVKISDLINSTETLQKLSQQDFKAKLAWSIARLLKSAEVEIQEFNTTRMNLIKKYGEKDENGELITDENGNCKIEQNSVDAFSTELNELINTEVEINANKIKVEQLEEINFTPSEMAILEPFIEFEE
jgi:hypothetical protein